MYLLAGKSFPLINAMKIFESHTIKEIDNATCEAQNIDSLQLMERAANAVACEIITRFFPTQRIVVIAGPGNNGGDALAVARILYEQGYKKVEVFLFNVIGKLSHDCEEERKKLITMDGIDFMLNRLVDKGNTVLVIEHNLDVVCAADHVIDMGPGGGKNGGHIITTGTPAQVAKSDSPTAPFIREVLEGVQKDRSDSKP